jgi:hypothetical protein
LSINLLGLFLGAKNLYCLEAEPLSGVEHNVLYDLDSLVWLVTANTGKKKLFSLMSGTGRDLILRNNGRLHAVAAIVTQ